MMANVTKSEQMAEQGGEQLPPTNLTLIDSGTTRHMLGVDGIKYAANVRPTKPCTFSTAGGAVELSMEGDALLRNGSVLSNCLLN
jgi:hypothetical protein